MRRWFWIYALVFILCTAPVNAGPRHNVLPGPLNAEVIRVVDGDTVIMRVQVWIDQSVETLVRVDGIDTPELKGKCATERQRAQAARKMAEDFLNAGRAELRNVRLEKYAGRVLADVHAQNGQSLAAYMIESGYARPYAGARRQGWCGD